MEIGHFRRIFAEFFHFRRNLGEILSVGFSSLAKVPSRFLIICRSADGDHLTEDKYGHQPHLSGGGSLASILHPAGGKDGGS